jgi:hypothetical protein
MVVSLSVTIRRYTVAIKDLKLLGPLRESVDVMESGLVSNPFADKKRVSVFPI